MSDKKRISEATQLQHIGERINSYRGWAARLACAMYNGEQWDREQMVEFLMFDDEIEPPEELTLDDAEAAMDAIFERAGI